LAAGMDDYLSKPIRSDELRLKLEQWTKPTNTPLGGKQNGSKVKPPAFTGELSVIDLSVLAGHREIQQPDQADFVTELIDLFLKDTVSHLKILREAVSKNDDNELRRVAHMLKGGSANIGAARMTALYEELETKKLANGEAATLVSKIENEFEGVREALKAERR
jgi:HPt (histidine-containing phosphotransfer) domain-containing protein